MTTARIISSIDLIPECDYCELFAFPELVHGLLLEVLVCSYVSVVHWGDTNELVDLIVRIGTSKKALAKTRRNGLNHRPFKLKTFAYA